MISELLGIEGDAWIAVMNFIKRIGYAVLLALYVGVYLRVSFLVAGYCAEMSFC